jgi:hypothetical protein
MRAESELFGASVPCSSLTGFSGIAVILANNGICVQLMATAYH